MQFYLEVYIQHHSVSDKRATILSLAGTLSYAWFFILVGVFNLVLHHANVRWAYTIIAAPAIVVALIDVVRRVPWAEGTTVPIEVLDAEFK